MISAMNGRWHERFVLRLSTRVGLATGLVLCSLLPLALVSAAPLPITRIPGSPFSFSPGTNSNVVLLSPDQKRLFVSNQDSSSITVLNVATTGALSYRGMAPVLPTSVDPPSVPTGMATNPTGTRLYVAVCEDEVAVFDVAADGGLSPRQRASLGVNDENCAAQGLTYVAHPNGGASDYLYVNNGWAPNSVSRFRVETDGSLALQGITETGGDAGGGGLIATPTARTMRACEGGCHLFVANGSTFGGTNDISVFEIGTDGSLAGVAGSPFALPLEEISSGAIALAPDDTALFAGTWDGDLVRFDVSPDGGLSGAVVATTGVTGAVNGLEVHPCGEYLAATFGPNPLDEKETIVNRIVAVSTASLVPVGASITGDGSEAAGLAFYPGRGILFVGNATAVGQQVSAYRFNPYGDTTAPSCLLAATRSGPPTEIDIRLQDTGSGLASVEVTVAQNIDVAVSFEPGTRNAVIVTATRRDARYKARVDLRVTDCAGNVVDCDPVIAEIEIPRGKSRWRREYRDVPQMERFITVQNGTPGIEVIVVRVNGKLAGTLTFVDGQTQTLDVESLMRRKRNRIMVSATGPPGGRAVLVIADTPGVPSSHPDKRRSQ